MKKQLLTLLFAIISVISFSQVPSYVPTNGLVGYWPFNGNANDESGNGNNGTVNGATLTSDRFGNVNKAYNFNLNYITIGNNPIFNFTNSMSINVWYKINPSANGSSQNMFFVSKHIGSSTSSSYCIYNENVCGPTIYLTDQNSQIHYLRNINFCDTSNWHMLTMTLSNSNLKMYIDGSLFTSSIVTSNIKQTNLPMIFGGCNNSPLGTDIIGRMIGLLDDIGIWNRALDSSEISNLYNGNICYQYITVTDTLIINTNLTGFNPVNYQNTIKIWPNPTNDHITIDYGNYANLSGYQLKINNSVGQQMFQTNIVQQTSYVDLGTWTGNGIYFVHLIDSQGNTVDIRKIVLQ